MSCIEFVHLFCDGCQAWFQDECYIYRREARLAAKKEGWIHIKGKDYCPVCKSNNPIHPTILSKMEFK